MLRLAERTPFPIAIEASGWTLEQVAALDPGWIAECRRLVGEGRVELVGSAYTQCAAPLLPAEVNRWNLELGLEAYERLLGLRPAIALVAEQAYAPGLVPLYREAGYDAIVVDWDNAFSAHPGWPLDLRARPQRARGGGESLPAIWSESLVFQRFQRLAHGDLPLDDYVRWVADRAAEHPHDSALLLYANDAEVFDHRPGRFAAEPPPGEGEWDRIAEALTAVAAIGEPAAPSSFLTLLDRAGAGAELQLESPAEPIPVKKQGKYNVARWACTGRDDMQVNTRCQRLYARLAAGGADAEARRELCYLWSSDFRTHITERRFAAYLERLAAAEERYGSAPPAPRPARPGRPLAGGDGGGVRLAEDGLSVELSPRRGLAVTALHDERLSSRPLLGTIPHGWFHTIDLGADWYSGSLVFEAPLRHKVTDLERVEPRACTTDDGRPAVHARIETELGPVEKVVSLDPASRALELEYALGWPDVPPGSLRLGFLTLLPDAFDAGSLWYATHNGGTELERHALDGQPFDHGAAVSALVSCDQGLGATEGVVWIGDRERALRVEVELGAAKPLALLSFRPAAPGYLLRLVFTLAETDDTRRGPFDLRDRRFRLRVSPQASPEALAA